MHMKLQLYQNSANSLAHNQNIHIHKMFTLLPPTGSDLSATVFPLHVLVLWPSSLHVPHLTVS